MNIANKLTVGLVSIAFVASATVTFAVPTGAQSVAELQAQLAALTAQLAALEGASTVTTTVPTSRTSNAACPYTWARNLTIGSTGDDVRQLQRFLNGNPQTQVATSGAGSPGNETSYYGPATARAVSRFQEMHAAQILTPLGLTKGTGGFYTSTRNHANNLCRSAPQVTRPVPPVAVPAPPIVVTPKPTPAPTPTQPTQVRVTGDTLAVTAGKHPGDSFAVAGAQRVPFTSVVLTAGSSDVRVEGIKVKQFGLASSSNFESVALVDVNGVQIGSARSFNSRDEAILGGNFVIPRNRSITLAVVGNISMDDDDISSGAVTGIEVMEVAAETQVQGQFPIRGAAHVISDSITLQTVEISVSTSETEIELGVDAEVATVEVSFDQSGADEEDGYLRSLTLEQDGGANAEEVGDVEVLVDGDEADYSLVVDGDRYVINFDSPGVLIEEDETIDLTLQINTETGSGETVRFTIDDTADVYVVGKKYGYGLPVTLGSTDDEIAKNSNRVSEEGYSDIQAGTIDKAARVKDFEDEIIYGRDRVLGALEVEFEGEDIRLSDLTFEVELMLQNKHYVDAPSKNAWDIASEETVELKRLHLRVDGERLAYADEDVEFDEPTSAPTDNKMVEIVEFSEEFDIDVRGTRDVLFEIVGDLDDEWSNFDGAEIKFMLKEVGTAEGLVSDDDYTDSGEFFADDTADEREFESVTIKGNALDFALTSSGVDETSYVAGSEDVVFATLEVDADEAVDDVELTNLYVTFEASHVAPADECRKA